MKRPNTKARRRLLKAVIYRLIADAFLSFDEDANITIVETLEKLLYPQRFPNWKE